MYDIVEEDDRPSIVMELVPFRSLRDAVAEDGPMAPAQAARIGLSVLAALRAVHEVGVVHRDVKPANILLGPEGRVVLADFGIAKAADSPALTVSGVLLGSPSFLAPERARGGRAGVAADLWALGASLYAAVEGRPPFERDGVLASLTAVVADELEPSSRAGPLWPVIEGLLRKDPADRLEAAAAEQMLNRVATDGDPARDEDGQDEANGLAARDPVTDDVAARPEHPDAAPADTGTHPPLDRPLEPVPPAQPTPRVPGSRTGGSRRFRGGPAALTAVAAIAVIAAGLAMVFGRPSHDQAAQQANPGRRVPRPSRRRRAERRLRLPRARCASVAPSTPSAAASGNSGSSALPAGYYRFTNSTGFSIGVPRGWQISHDGHYVYIRDPANSGIFLLIDQSDQPKPNPLADWQQQAANRQGTYPGYHLILLRAVRYTQAEKAADWEFTYDRNGVTVQVLNRNILANARHAYALYWSTPVSDWNAYYHYFQVFAATFRPAS